MELKELLGTSFDCTCGRHHTVPTEHLVYRPDAFDRIAEIGESIVAGGKCLLIADSRTFEAAGKAVVTALSSSSLDTSVYIVPDHQNESPATDDRTRDLIREQAPPADLYLAVGSGVINDLVKWISFLEQKPYITVATAASMNGYGSANVAATIDGLKVLFHAEAPRAVFAQPDILMDAPDELTTSGLGDVLAKSVSSADWKLNQFLFGDYYCQFSVDLLKDLEPVYLDNPARIKNREPAGIEALFQALFYSSVAMTITGTSSPASGGEHLISHTIDITAGRDGRKHDLHGRQVGVASILMAALYERIMTIDQPRFVHPQDKVNAEFWGTLTDIVAQEYQKKLVKMDQAAALLSQPEKWHGLKKLIAPSLVPAAKLKNCLKTAGAAHTVASIRIDNRPFELHDFLPVVMYANQMRDRFTILDLAILLGIIPSEIEGLIDTWLVDRHTL